VGGFCSLCRDLFIAEIVSLVGGGLHGPIIFLAIMEALDWAYWYLGFEDPKEPDDPE